MAASEYLISPGLLRWPGASPLSRKTASRIVEEDMQQHHCYFTSRGLHDHLNHHILAAFDLGASPQLLKKIEADHLPFQRDIHIDTDKEPAQIDESNWTEHLGVSEAYAPYVGFFARQIKELGIKGAMERYLTSKDANTEKTRMLVRLTCSVLHPLIVAGMGVEFHSYATAAQGLAMTAIAPERPSVLFPKQWPPWHPEKGVKEAHSRGNSPLFGVLAELLQSDILEPPLPYDPDALLSKRVTEAVAGDRAAEIHRIAAMWDIDIHGDDAHFEDKLQECFFFATCLLGGAGRRGKKPRLDFFLMHILTSSAFLPSFVKTFSKPEDKAAILMSWMRMALLTILVRGRPRVDPWLLMSYSASPSPPHEAASPVNPGPKAIGGNTPADQNPWMDVIRFGLLASDWHLAKVLRPLIYADQQWGLREAGQIPGCKAIRGLELVDGTVFLRVAGVAMDIMGWKSTQVGDGGWDRSCLGYDDAWKNEEAIPFDVNVLDARLRHLAFSDNK